MVDLKARAMAGACAAALLACATAPAKPSAPEATARDYAPLPVGASWTYQVSYPGQAGEMTVKLTGENDGFVLDDKNGAFKHTQEGLRDRERYLIRHPLQPGNKWTTVVGPSAVEHLQIDSVGAPCEAIAGRFEDCIEVSGSIRRDKNMTLLIHWTWARGVGLVKLETIAEIAGKGRVPQVKQSLKDYSVAGASRPEPAERDDGPDTWVSE